MAEAIATYDVTIKGLWNTAHTFANEEGVVGVLHVRRGRGGLVTAGRYMPARGEILIFRRDPGLLRSQFSLWTESKEWLGSALRWNLLRREIVLHTGSKPLRLVPTPEFGFGWSLQAPKTGEMAHLRGMPLSRRARVEVFRKLDFEILLFAYFLGSQILRESLLPGPRSESLAEPASPPKSPARPVGS